MDIMEDEKIQGKKPRHSSSSASPQRGRSHQPKDGITSGSPGPVVQHRKLPKSLVPRPQENKWSGIPDLNKISLVIEISQKSPDGEQLHANEWTGRISVRCSNLPLLMRKGFRWSEANVIPERGHIDPCTSKKWKYSRVWYLRDKGFKPKWTAKLMIYDRDLTCVSNFNVGTLRGEDINRVDGWSEEGRNVIQYIAGFPELSFNAVYDDKPLQDWAELAGKGNGQKKK